MITGVRRLLGRDERHGRAGMTLAIVVSSSGAAAEAPRTRDGLRRRGQQQHAAEDALTVEAVPEAVATPKLPPPPRSAQKSSGSMPR